ncbi:hypothetical protein G8A07_18250 [Roseateles sp. DAIF2]|uniref:hypothetical protein n=1 Tax=Roseateles sp. DAIF2 TaxID=2714952 RepID=UPI0018A2598F|nr:hypothetical protein [Roseateles sp. DAIF2]QPF74668.1 hypothetical protein G8A07_18250 [Roseateles sp. DAIF2]
MSSDSVMPEFPVAGLVLLGLLALVALLAWLRVPGAAASWMRWMPSGAARGEAAAPRVMGRQRLDALTVLYDLEWADGRRLLLCATRGVAPVVLDQYPAPTPQAPMAGAGAAAKEQEA